MVLRWNKPVFCQCLLSLNESVGRKKIPSLSHIQARSSSRPLGYSSSMFSVTTVTGMSEQWFKMCSVPEPKTALLSNRGSNSKPSRVVLHGWGLLGKRLHLLRSEIPRRPTMTASAPRSLRTEQSPHPPPGERQEARLARPWPTARSPRTEQRSKHHPQTCHFCGNGSGPLNTPSSQDRNAT